MLIGQYIGILSAKHRVAIPKKFREELGEKVIIAKWYEECLVIISDKNWLALLDKLTGKQEIITSPVRDTDRFILGSAYELNCDDQGRVVLPIPLTDYAKLTKDIVFLGLGDRIEIWDKQGWQKRETFIASHAGEMIEELAQKTH